MIECWDASRWGTLNEENMRDRLRAVGCSSVSHYVYPPGTVFEEHIHPVEKIDAVLQGEFLITLEGQEFLLRAGDLVRVPARVRHSARVIGDQSVVSLDAISSQDSGQS